MVVLDNAIKLTPLYGEGRSASYYYLPDGIDWDYLSSIIIANPAMNVLLKDDGDTYDRDISGRLEDIWKYEDGHKSHVYNADFPEDDPHGIFGSNLNPFEAEFTFSYPLAEPLRVIVENWDKSESYTIYQQETSDPCRIELPPYPAHYTVFATFADSNGDLYDAKFCFSIGEL